MVNTGHIWNSKQDIFQILQPCRKSGNWWGDCVVQRKGDFQTLYSQETQAFWHHNVQSLRLEWLHKWHESLLGEGQTMHVTALLSNPCHSNRTDKEDRRTWPKIVHGQFLFLVWTFWWSDQKFNRGTVRRNRKGMPEDLWCRTVKLRWGDIQYGGWTRATSACWLTFTICYNFHDEQGNMIKPKIMADCNHHMDYVDKDDRMANSYSINCWTWKWMKELFSYLFGVVILNSCIFLSWWGGKKISHKCLTRPSEEFAGSGWTRAVARETCREKIHCFCEHCKTHYHLQ